jgi:FkbM family methyltransferase
MSLYAKAVCPHAVVIAIEPSHREVSRLLRNLDLSGISIPVVVAAAGSEMIGLRLSPAGNMGMSTTHAAGECAGAAPVTGLDLGRFLGIDVLRRTRVVKLDIEGSELPVLRELPLAEMRRAVFVVECLADTPRHAAATDAVYELFRANGFEPHYRPGGRDDWEEVFYAPAHNPVPVFSADL